MHICLHNNFFAGSNFSMFTKMTHKIDDAVFFNVMPIVGLGTFKSASEDIKTAVDAALEVGYRHIDTAYLYNNEAAIGKTLKKWFDSGKLNREDLFIVTKLPHTRNRAESVEKYITRSLTALQLEYVDLYLVHNPIGLLERGEEFLPKDEQDNPLLDMKTDHLSLWKAMEAQVDAGRTKAIGLSNFNARQIKSIYKAARIPPANLQIELHIYLQQRELVAFCKALDITVCAYAPLGSPGFKEFVKQTGGSVSHLPTYSPLTEPVVLDIAKKYNKTPAQIILRHIIERGIVVIPKSITPAQIKENFQVFDFKLSEDDTYELDRLDRGNRGHLFASPILGASEDGYSDEENVLNGPENYFVSCENISDFPQNSLLYDDPIIMLMGAIEEKKAEGKVKQGFYEGTCRDQKENITVDNEKERETNLLEDMEKEVSKIEQEWTLIEKERNDLKQTKKTLQKTLKEIEKEKHTLSEERKTLEYDRLDLIKQQNDIKNDLSILDKKRLEIKTLSSQMNDDKIKTEEYQNYHKQMEKEMAIEKEVLKKEILILQQEEIKQKDSDIEKSKFWIEEYEKLLQNTQTCFNDEKEIMVNKIKNLEHQNKLLADKNNENETFIKVFKEEKEIMVNKIKNLEHQNKLLAAKNNENETFIKVFKEEKEIMVNKIKNSEHQNKLLADKNNENETFIKVFKEEKEKFQKEYEFYNHPCATKPPTKEEILRLQEILRNPPPLKNETEPLNFDHHKKYIIK